MKNIFITLVGVSCFLNPIYATDKTDISYRIVDLGPIASKKGKTNYEPTFFINQKGQALHAAASSLGSSTINQDLRVYTEKNETKLLSRGYEWLIKNFNDNGAFVGLHTCYTHPLRNQYAFAYFPEFEKATGNGLVRWEPERGSIGILADINNQNVMVGWEEVPSQNGTLENHVFIYSPSIGTQFLSNRIPNNIYEVSKINNLNQIIGTWSHVLHDFPYEQHKAFVYDPDNGFMDLGEIVSTKFKIKNGYVESESKLLNDQGQVAGILNAEEFFIGSSGDRTLPKFNGIWIWEKAKGLWKHTSEEEYTLASLNQKGQIVGYYNEGSHSQPFYADMQKGMISILKKCDTYGEALWINDTGQVVGSYWTWNSGKWRETRKAFLWNKSEGLRNLNQLIPQDSLWKITEAKMINNRGEIIAIGLYEGIQHTVLLIPITMLR